MNKYCDNCNTVISTVIEVIYGFFGCVLIFSFFHVDIIIMYMCNAVIFIQMCFLIGFWVQCCVNKFFIYGWDKMVVSNTSCLGCKL